ncbi:hypothetical protein Tamer19_17390 [Cupriavidus sp. TA19]|uniref:hypothetical protein n=1 Tax=Cupriavidus sp. TA19 TaxID=701108 RepID=UPI0027294E3A|nr:hypothetical protein [Cupriavidus sp. TA19]GLC92331.1 hypothetical protein Tamer19_17390 [Cupriavidus sp. TA19]
MNAVFIDTRQALYVAHMVMALPPRQKAPFRTALIRAMEATPNLTGMQEAWLDQLRGTPSDSTVDFGGLTSDEVRGQCAMVMSAVDSKLPAPERAVVRARFTPAEYEEIGAGGQRQRRYFYGPARVEGIRYLSDWLAPSISSIAGSALDMLVAKAFANHERLAFSFRDMEANFGGGKSTYARAYAAVKGRLKGLEEEAVRRLDGYFTAMGLVTPEEVSA